ncbi:MAG: beta-mannosidase [Clostridia bacterium]|nr:beta-mannosidase [Clostridia bacterium]
MKQLLNEGWRLLHRGLEVSNVSIDEILRADDFIHAGSLPCDVRMPLIRHGIIRDPVVADYCFESEWVEQKSWWFTKEFVIAPQDQHGRSIRLVLESLDLCADIFVNAQHVGSHQSCHYPFETEVSRCVREGKNTLTVRLTAGHEKVAPEQLRYIEDYICTESRDGRGDRGEKARAFLRKPQYVYGWDWAPRIATIGIMKNAFLVIQHNFAITQVHPVTLEADAESKRARMRFEVQFDNYKPISTSETTVLLDMRIGDEKVLSLQKEVLAVSGVNFVNFEAEIQNARLWWPSGAGEQPLYTVCVTLKTEDGEYTAEPVQTGIRTVSLNLDKCGEGSRRFAIEVNGIPIYCKGGNWIPADSIYARVTPEKYEALIREARDCNFNMLRVWGGGIYERDVFYDLCDQQGILVWQDLMFACSLYPDDQEWFLRECEREIHYQAKRLRHHPCLALWCGNNENQSIFERYFAGMETGAATGGLVIYNQLAPSILRDISPEIPYWRSSPYGGYWPNDNDVGDRHHWGDCTMNNDMEKRITPEEYDKTTSKFISEYGYIGPCSDKTIGKYYGDNQVIRGDRIWNLHNNTFEKETVPAGIRKHYAEPDALELCDYLQYARLVQGLMYAYSLESIRFYEHSSGSLFWMYNDAWGEVGWTIIDYYLDRKPSYYFVKRAFAPVKLILRPSADQKSVLVMGINDTPEKARLRMEYGYAGFDGAFDTARQEIVVEPFSKGIVAMFDMPKKDKRRGVVFARADGIPLAILRTGDFKDYALAQSAVTIENIQAKGSDYEVTVRSDGYSHAVSFGLDASIRLSDEYFDMLPGDTRTIVLYDAVSKVDKANIQARGIGGN